MPGDGRSLGWFAENDKGEPVYLGAVLSDALEMLENWNKHGTQATG
jgi:hypothetical protein